ncbi:MAG: hypothetical protein CK426_05675 [Legionella sp.]|nr:MAG: hypothetical protein CK423_06935 [Legionella sp.]PJD98533.1 MAG: hypothetical protein CK426_05675 [Legionella sp.]
MNHTPPPLLDDDSALDYFCELIDDTVEQHEFSKNYRDCLYQRDFEKALALRKQSAGLHGTSFMIPLPILHEFSCYLLIHDPDYFNGHIQLNPLLFTYFIGCEVQHDAITYRGTPKQIADNFTLALSQKNKLLIRSIWNNTQPWSNHTTFSDYLKGLPVIMNQFDNNNMLQSVLYQMSTEELVLSSQKILAARIFYIIEAIWPHTKTHIIQAIRTLNKRALCDLIKECATSCSIKFFNDFIEEMDQTDGLTLALREIKKNNSQRKIISDRLNQLYANTPSPSYLKKRLREEQTVDNQPDARFFQSITARAETPFSITDSTEENMQSKQCS